MKRASGFTLIELSVVLAVMAVVSAIAIPYGMRTFESYRFSAMSRAFANAVLMARMRAIENRCVFPITASQAGSSPGWTKFTTALDVPLRFRANTLGTIPGNGDRVMLSGLDKNTNVNGGEYEVQTCPKGVNPPTFEVNCPFGGTPDTRGTVRNLTAPARLIILPAEHKVSANWGVDPATGMYRNEDNFGASGYTVREEGSDIVFSFDVNKYRIFFSATEGVLGDELEPGGSDPTAGGTGPFAFQQMLFDSRGLPENLASRTVLLCSTRFYPKGGPKTVALDSPGTILYFITSTGRVTTPIGTK